MVLRASATLILTLLLASALPFPTSAVPSADAPLAPAVVRMDARSVLDGANAGAFRLDLLGERFAFDVEPNPIAQGAVVGVNGLPVGRVVDTVTFWGTANGVPAALAATRAGVFALALADDPLLVQPLWVTVPGASPDLHQVVRWSQSPPVIPGHPDPAGHVPLPAVPSVPAAGPPEPTDRVAKFLIESDALFYERTTGFETCQAHTEHECWVEVQQAILALAQLLFEPQTGVRFEITSQWVCVTVEACPYAGESMSNDLDAFRTRWEAIEDEPYHDLGHFLVATDYPQFAGLAYGASVATASGYAASESLVFAIGTGGSFLQYATVAHEIGHNFNAIHQEAHAIPPLPVGVGAVWTIMAPGKAVQLSFSNGVLVPDKNNAARVIQIANERLPGS